MNLVYLAGPITGDADPRGWREYVAGILPSNWRAMNPLKWEAKDMTDAQVVRLDYSKIVTCQAVLAMCHTPSWGTAMEICYARRMGLPVVGVCNLEREAMSPWLRYHAHHISPTLEGAVQYLGELRGL